MTSKIGKIFSIKLLLYLGTLGKGYMIEYSDNTFHSFCQTSNDSEIEEEDEDERTLNSLSHFISLGGFCHTQLHLGFSAKLRIWQVPACKIETQSGIIL